jgi:hypothetical protein
LIEVCPKHNQKYGVFTGLKCNDKNPLCSLSSGAT